MIRNHLNDSLTVIIRDLGEDSFHFDRIDGLQYRLDWLYNSTVRYLDIGEVDERVVRWSIQQVKDCLQGSYGENTCTVSLCRVQEVVKEDDPSLKYQKNSWNFWLKRASVQGKSECFSVSASVSHAFVWFVWQITRLLGITLKLSPPIDTIKDVVWKLGT